MSPSLSIVHILGRAWLLDEQPDQVEIWEHALEPMQGLGRSGAEWAQEHLASCYTPEGLRELLGVPAVGNFQVLFRGRLVGQWESHGLDGEDWDEVFEVEETKHEEIPSEYMDMRFPKSEKRRPPGCSIQ